MQNSIAAASSKQAIRYMNLKNPLKQTMVTAVHTGDMPLAYRKLNKINATTANAIIRIHLPAFDLLKHSLAFMTLYYYQMKHVISNFKGRNAYRLHRQGFRGKIPERSEDDFSRNLEALTLPVKQGGALPLPANWNDKMYGLALSCFLHFFCG